MLILVANLGSTSFKFRLFRLRGAAETELARGGVERLGTPQARSYAKTAKGSGEAVGLVPDHAAAIEACLALLRDPKVGVVKADEQLDGVGFKAVHGGEVTGVQLVDDRVLAAMEEFAAVAPAHNPVYIAAMKLLREKLPGVPLVAAFETGFHGSIPPERTAYAVPAHWPAAVRRYGFHGASHSYIAERMFGLLGQDNLKVISCHLGGSSSLCAIADGVSEATTMGFSPQSGLPQNNRVGDLDVFALAYVHKHGGKSLDELLKELTSQSGLAGLAAGSNDLQAIEAAAAGGCPQSLHALRVYVEAVRHYLGAYLVVLGGADALVFTGGIGENSAYIRDAVCANLEWFGIDLDAQKNVEAKGEAAIHSAGSRVQIWTVPTNEELIVARQTRDLLAGEPPAGEPPASAGG